MKVGIIRCQQTESMCPGSACFVFAARGKGAFEETGPCEIAGFVSCGGCPGKNVVPRVNMMIERGVDAIAFASCMKRGTPIGFPCPHYADILETVGNNLDKPVKILDYTH
ncbi:CGGC domain-containing protein [Candidatus Ozemobacteraceae bacterium]|nr:CGGC domain-containing protein [Candidatus Ozemobacteraceae bacterium]